MRLSGCRAVGGGVVACCAGGEVDRALVGCVRPCLWTVGGRMRRKDRASRRRGRAGWYVSQQVLERVQLREGYGELDAQG